MPRPLGETDAPSGYYEYLPPGYGDGTPRPLLVFLQGFGGNGDGSAGQPASPRATIRLADVGHCGWPRCAAELACNDEAVREKVLVVDDHEAFRTSARELLEADGFDVVGEVATGEDAVLAASRLKPRLVVLDVRLPDVDGFEVAGRLAALDDPPDVVLVSSRDAGSYGPRIARAPVRGFLAKSELSGAALRRLLP